MCNSADKELNSAGASQKTDRPKRRKENEKKKEDTNNAAPNHFRSLKWVGIIANSSFRG